LSNQLTMKSAIKSPSIGIFRRAYIRRRTLGTGLFEEDWLEISTDIKSYGKITIQVDNGRRGKLTFSNAKIVVDNKLGKYNPHTSQNSLWYGFLNQQRTLLKIEAGFVNQTKNDNGIWTRNEFNDQTTWDESVWDADSAVWDFEETSSIFIGIISGDLLQSDKNDVSLNVKPLISVFQDFPARNLTGYTSTGMTASKFVEMVRDQTDGAGNFIFRPFFDNTTSNWDISATSNVFENLNTSTAKDVIDRNVWEVIEKIAEAENFVPYVNKDGVFKFISRSSVDSSIAYEFHGAGSFNTEYGQTVKEVQSFGFPISKFYSRVSVKFREGDTQTSYEVVEASLTVDGNSNAWALGVRTLDIENIYIQDTTAAEFMAQEIFDDVSSLKNEIKFTTTFIPHLDLFDRFKVYYDPAPVSVQNLWDQNNWADDGVDSEEYLIFDKTDGDSILLRGEEFKFLSFEIDLDNLENTFLAREV